MCCSQRIGQKSRYRSAVDMTILRTIGYCTSFSEHIDQTNMFRSLYLWTYWSNISVSMELWVGMVYVLQGRVLVFSRRLGLNSTNSQNTTRDAFERQNNNQNVGKKERKNDDSTRDRSIARNLHRLVSTKPSILQLMFFHFIIIMRGFDFLQILVCIHTTFFFYVVLYSTRAAQIGILHQKDVNRLNFITTVVRKYSILYPAGIRL